MLYTIQHAGSLETVSIMVMCSQGLAAEQCAKPLANSSHKAATTLQDDSWQLQ